MKKFKKIITVALAVVLMLSVLPYVGQKADAAYSPAYSVVKVGLNSRTNTSGAEISSVTLKNSSGFYIGTYNTDRGFNQTVSIDSDTLTVVADSGTVRVSNSSGGVVASGSQKQAILPKSDIGTSYGTSDSYYGGFEFICSGSTMTVVNYVDIEKYVMGVVPNEMPASWPVESLKAQALCARTYVASHFDAYKSYGFDVVNTSYSQVYNGVYTNTTYSSKITAVCQDTAGQYILYNGELIEAYFHSCSGGATENSENVWSKAYGYLKGVSDPYETTPITYSGVFTADQIYSKIKAKTSSLTLTNIASISCTYTAMGNIDSVTLKDAAGNTQTYSKESARTNILGAFTSYTSQRFRIEVGGTLSASAADAQGTDQEQEIVDEEFQEIIEQDIGTQIITEAEDSDVYTGSEPAYTTEETESDPTAAASGNDEYSLGLLSTETIDLLSSQTYTISSRGWGHNIGMSQYGAKGMAEAGKSYVDIIAHYYTGVTLSTIPFADVPASQWYYNYVVYVYEKGLFNGTGPTTFEPESSMTRGQLVTVLGRLSGIDTSAYPGNGGFNDVSGSEYYAPYVQWAASVGLIDGYGDGRYGPNDAVTREQMCVFIKRYADTVGKSLPAKNAAVTFSDSGAIGDWAIADVQALQMAGIIDGIGNNMFSPAGKCTRAQVATILNRYLEM